MGGPLRPIIISITGPGGVRETPREDGEWKESRRGRRARVEDLRSREADRRRGFADLSGRKLTTGLSSAGWPAVFEIERGRRDALVRPRNRRVTRFACEARRLRDS